jgi:rubrerythrin
MVFLPGNYKLYGLLEDIMSQEQETTAGALQYALKMEIDGKAFYLQAGGSSENKLGQRLFKRLAAEEDVHRAVFQKIYDAIKAKKGWPEARFKADSGKVLRTVFSEALEHLGKDIQPAAAELDAVQTGMDMENKTLDFYTRRAKVASYAAEKELYDELARQEREHHRLLMDYYDFLKDPAQFYVKMEHTSVDGG